MADAAEFAPRKRVVVDASAIRDNTAALVRHVGPDVQVMAMVKSNGYGHGLRVAAEAAVAGGATWLGVASSVEAIEALEALEALATGVSVLVVGRADPGSHEALVTAGVHTTVYDREGVQATAAAARRVGAPARVHLKVDTGMGRLGVQPEAVGEIVGEIAAHPSELELVGVFTNFADSDAPDLSYTEHQHACFVSVVTAVRAVAPGALAHCSNSGAILRAPHMHHDMVRPGLALYGYAPDVAADLVDLRIAMTMVAPVTQVKTVAAGTPVGYGRTWTATRTTRIATIAAGYADGVLRAQSNRGAVLVAGCRRPIVGRVSMDQLCVDLGDGGRGDDDVRPGDDAVLFGEQRGVRLGADEVGEAAGTIEREVLTAVPDRIPRVVTPR